MDAPVLNSGGWTLTQDANSYRGMFISTNGVNFTGVAYETSLPTLRFELHGVEVSPIAQGPIFIYTETVSVSGAVSVTLLRNPSQLVAVNAESPEPSTLLLAAAALGMVLLARRHWSPAPTRSDTRVS